MVERLAGHVMVGEDFVGVDGVRGSVILRIDLVVNDPLRHGRGPVDRKRRIGDREWAGRRGVGSFLNFGGSGALWSSRNGLAIDESGDTKDKQGNDSNELPANPSLNSSPR